MIGMIAVRYFTTYIYRSFDLSNVTKYETGIRKCVSWYASHIARMHSSSFGGRGARDGKGTGLPPPVVILVTDDAANRRKAAEEGLRAKAVREYVEGMPNAEALLDLLAVTDDNEAVEMTQAAAARAAAVYPEVRVHNVLCTIIDIPMIANFVSVRIGSISRSRRSSQA